MATKTHVYDGSNWRTIKKVYVYDAGSAAWRLIRYSWVYDGTSWRQAHTNAFIFNKTFSAPASNYDLMNDIKSLPAPTAWNGTDDIEATITVNPGVSVFSSVSGPTGYAMRISPNPSSYPGSSFPASSLIILNNYGYIVGKGGDGGNGGSNDPTYGGSGSVGSSGSPALILAFSTKVTNFAGSFIASGGGGGGGGGAAFIFRPFGKGGNAGAAAGGSGGGGGAYGAPTGSSSSKGLGGNSPPAQIVPYNGPPTGISPGNDGNDGATSAGAGGSAKANIFDYPNPPAPTAWTATGGAGGAGGDKGNSGATGQNGVATATGPLSPASLPYAGSGAIGGATGTSVIGTSFYAPGSSVPAPTIFGPTTA